MLKMFRIEFDPYRFEGEQYDVQEWRSLEDENPDWDEGLYCYAGYGRFCKTREQAEEWARTRVPLGVKPDIEYVNC